MEGGGGGTRHPLRPNTHSTSPRASRTILSRIWNSHFYTRIYLTLSIYPLHYPMPYYNLTGMRFGKWLVLEHTGRVGRSTWRCKCDCGRIKDKVLYAALVSGRSTSCSCSRRKEPNPANKLRAIWSGIKTRCYNKNHPGYKNYGARGITMCDEWSNSFKTFCADMYPRPSMNHTVERRNNDGPYCKDNCYWATRKQQGANKRNNKWFEWSGKMMILAQIARAEDVDYISLRNRIFVAGLQLTDAVEHCKTRGLKYKNRDKKIYDTPKTY